jgi:hypothetical protein
MEGFSANQNYFKVVTDLHSPSSAEGGQVSQFIERNSEADFETRRVERYRSEV